MAEEAPLEDVIPIIEKPEAEGSKVVVYSNRPPIQVVKDKQSAKSKGRNLQKYVRDKIYEIFPTLEKGDIESTSIGASGVDLKEGQTRYEGNYAGGAVRVIAAAKPRLWIAPDVERISEAKWNKMSQAEKEALPEPLDPQKIPSLNGVAVQTFKVPEHYYQQQYEVYANGILWPVMHSRDLTFNFEPASGLVRRALQKALGKQEADKVNGYRFPFPSQVAEDAYRNGYKPLNELGNAAIKKLKQNGTIRYNDLFWVHDYQCVNVEGEFFSRHTPFPSIEYLEKVEFSDGKKLLDTGSFQDYMQHYVRHQLINFQRPSDMANFIETLAVMDKRFIANNRDLLERELLYHDGTHYRVSEKAAFHIGEKLAIKAFGHDVTLMNFPVGISQQTNLQEAIENEDKLDKTRIDPEKLENMGAIRESGPLGIILSAMRKVGNFLKDKLIQIPVFLNILEHSAAPPGKEEWPTFREVLQQAGALDDEHRIFMSVHRNDYTKNTLEKAQAAGDFLADLETKDPEKRKNTHFLFILEPTRQNIKSYVDYAQNVYKELAALKNIYGNSIIVIPQSVDHGDVMGILRHKNTVGLIGAGLKDGHDLTLREAIDARADGRGDHNPLALITTDGVGAVDILGGKGDRKGAFVIDTTQAVGDLSKFLRTSMTECLQQIDLALDNEGGNPAANVPENWWFGISAEGIGSVGMLLNFAVAWTVSRFTPPPPESVGRMVDLIRIPRGAGQAHEVNP